MRKSFLLLFSAFCCLTASAQYHGFRVKASQELIDNPFKKALPADVYHVQKGLNIVALYQPEYIPTKAKEDGKTFEHGTTTFNDASKAKEYRFVDWTLLDLDLCQAPDDPTRDALEFGDIDGAILKPVMDANGLMYLAVPDKYYLGGQLVPVPSTGGDIRLRFMMYYDKEGEKGRIGDEETMYVQDITGIYVTIDAPSTVSTTCNFIQANTSTPFNKGYVNGVRNKIYDDNFGNLQRQAIVTLPQTKGNGPEDITNPVDENTVTQFLNMFYYARQTDNWGFPIGYVDLVFYDIKPGERVGWTNLQTLHDGYTPVKYISSAVNEIEEDENAPVEYFNLQGIRVDNPENGVFIERKGSKIRKVVK